VPGTGIAEEGLGVVVQRAGVPDVQRQDPRQRQVDLAHLVDVDLVAEAAQPLDLLGGQRGLGGLGQFRPGGPIQLGVGSHLPRRLQHGAHCSHITAGYADRHVRH
jgi:hypothetical protein